MSTKTYDYLFKLLLIGDSGKYAIKILILYLKILCNFFSKILSFLVLTGVGKTCILFR